jgi:hypothetical protein
MKEKSEEIFDNSGRCGLLKKYINMLCLCLNTILIYFSELLLASNEDSREYQHDILQNIVQSYRKDQSNLFYKYSKPYLVQNKKLEQEVSISE